MNSNLIENRHIRIFVSSTFRDLTKERDHLVKHVFPRLEMLAEERAVTLTVVDLRWGITEKEASEGRVIDICFQEIENSVPFFIGILGERYGWCPTSNEITDKTKHIFPKIEAYLEKKMSITEMEMQFGALDRNTSMYASFYIKNVNDQNSEDTRLTSLKKLIRSQEKYPTSCFSSCDELGLNIEKDFILLLDKLFPAIDLSIHEKKCVGQSVYLHNLQTTYVKDTKRILQINRLLEESLSNQIVVVGESGVGKSAFVADMIEKWSSSFDIIYYFIGHGGCDCSKNSLLNFIENEFKKILNISDNVDYNIATLLNLYKDSGRNLILVIDAINILELNELEESLEWLPYPPTNIKLVITTTPESNRYYTLKNRNNSSVFDYKTLSLSQRKKIIVQYLDKYRKHLEPDWIKKILHNKVCHNTLVLRVLLDELVLYGEHESIFDFLDRYLKTNSVDDFFALLLKHYENDYGEMLVTKALTLLSLSDLGFSEAELLDMLNAKKQKKLFGIIGCKKKSDTDITPIQWSRFYCALRNNISDTNGLLKLSHQLVSEAIKKRYTYSRNKLERTLRKIIVQKFVTQENPRAWTELVNQYIELHSWEELHTLLTSQQAVLYFIENDSHLLTTAWTELCVYSNLKRDFDIIDFVNVWDSLPIYVKERTFNKAELVVAAVIIEEQGCWPPINCPLSFLKMQELCLKYTNDNGSKIHYAVSICQGYSSKQIEDKTLYYIHLIEDLLLTQKESFSDLESYEAFLELSKFYYNSNNVKALQFAQKSLELCILENGDSGKDTQLLYFIIGKIKYDENEFCDSLMYFEKALKCVDILSNVEISSQICTGIIRAYSSISIMAKTDQRYRDLANEENYEKYIHYFEKLIYLKKQIKGTEKEVKILSKMLDEMKENN